MANLTNALFTSGDTVDTTNVKTADSGHARLDNVKVAIFAGTTAAQRLAAFLRTYVNQVVLDVGGDAKDPEDYTNTDLGLPAGCLLSIYYVEGMWFLHYQDHNPYNVDNMPFNRIPAPFDKGNAL